MLEQKQPADVGFEARYTWTLPLVAEWIKREFGVMTSVRGISAMLQRMNFSFTKATYLLAKADEEAQTFFRKHTFAQLKKQVEAEEIDHLLFEDESMIRSYQSLQYNWFPRGKQRKVYQRLGSTKGPSCSARSIMKPDRYIIVKKKKLMWTLLFAFLRIFCRRIRAEKSP